MAPRMLAVSVPSPPKDLLNRVYLFRICGHGRSQGRQRQPYQDLHRVSSRRAPGGVGSNDSRQETVDERIRARPKSSGAGEVEGENSTRNGKSACRNNRGLASPCFPCYAML